jgi:hypothetical protein
MWKRYWPIYERLEQEVCDFTFRVALSDDQRGVYSLTLAEFLLRACSDCENVGKALATQLPDALPKPSAGDNFPTVGRALCAALPFYTLTVDVVWPYQDLTDRSMTPFGTWSAPARPNPPWYGAYNAVKHDRAANLRLASYQIAVSALAGLFILNL